MLFDEKRPVGANFLDLERARKWDQRSAKLEGNHTEKARHIADQLKLTDKYTVADLGCGSGFFTIEIAQYCNKVHAVDISPVMLNILDEKIKSNGITNIACSNKGILEFLSGHDHLDALVLQLSFHHLPDFWKAVAIHHMARLLNQGARVFLSDVIYSFPVSEYKTHFKEMVDHLSSRGDDGLTTDAQKHLLEEYSTFDWIIEGMFEKCGFRVAAKTVNSSTHCDYVFERE